MQAEIKSKERMVRQADRCTISSLFIPYCNDNCDGCIVVDPVTYICVSIDGVWISDSVYWPLTGRTANNYNPLAIAILDSSLLHTLVSSAYYSVHYPFLTTDFNTGTLTDSLNYTLQTSLYFSTHKVFFSQPNSFLHNWTVNPQLSFSIP
jgi:hypothetical protein